VKKIFPIILALLVIGCANTYEMKSGGKPSPTLRLPQDVTFYIGHSNDGRFSHQVYKNSGMMTTQTIVRVLSGYARKVESADRYVSLKENLIAARIISADYLLQPTILHWEDRATEWSGKPDQITIRLEIFNVATGHSIDTTVISGKSKWATFGGDHPQDLLLEPLERYADILFTR
jgi:hypothetical protein